MANFKVIDPPPEVFTAKALAAINKGDALKFAAGGVTNVTSAGDTIDCFALEAIASGAYGRCCRGDMRLTGRAASAVDFAVGDKVYIAAGQALNTGAVGNKAVGTVVGDNPESAGWVDFQFDPQATFTHA